MTTWDTPCSATTRLTKICAVSGADSSATQGSKHIYLENLCYVPLRNVSTCFGLVWIHEYSFMIKGGWVVHGLMFHVFDSYGRLGGAWNNLRDIII